MKHLKPIISLLLILLIIISSVMTANADENDAVSDTDESLILGDIDGDGEVNIIDGTALQFHIVELKQLSEAALSRGDTDLDDITTITDVTHLQLYLASDGTRAFYLGMDIETAKQTKLSDEESAAFAADEELRLQSEALAAEESKVEKAARTTQAMKDYRARLKEIESSKMQIEESIRNYKKQKGVDISEFNGDVDFSKLKAAGYTFVMIRMGYGSNLYSQDDTLFEQNVKKAEAAGMPWGTYLYSYALDTAAVKSEINHTLRLLKGKKPTMPIAFDIEYDSYKINKGMPSDNMFDKDYCFKNYPVIIPAYGYNNHTALLDGGLASTGASPDDFETEDDCDPVPEGYNGVMGNSFR